ncbi:hypothetical protein AKJ41_03270 [candidate division MSBL1 archaeon SCGC-AAA259O05]|uniref:ABC transmembrane type-1 domain-containing protein n=1 Tax=candidate division MSBL1 archaeon SCGC-AAA259O05 TaxID=1698271 RepID=A0A133V3D9_9EURY|nr:hypothetical protein AKJ41_03270 [candidate division MSBL1 archaeon SCGC-AAA259O05]
MTRLIEKLRNNPFVPFLTKKVLFMLLAIFVVMSLIFIIPRLMPRSPVDLMIDQVTGSQTTLGSGSAPSGQGAVQALKEVYIEKFGINKPLTTQYVDFWERFFTMDFGVSYWQYPTPVSGLIAYSLPWTMALIIPVVPLGFVVGNWIGSRSAYYRGRLDNLLYYFSMYLFRAPYYWFALVFLLVFGYYLGAFPLSGAYSPLTYERPIMSFDWFVDALQHFALPFLSLVGIGVGGWAVGMRAMTVYEMESDYITYSKQLGFSKDKLRQYAERNAILPNFTWIPITFKTLISQTLLVEVVFGYPGLGYLAYHGVMAQDYPLIQACFAISILIVLIGNFIADLMYGKLDPRIGSGYVSKG